MKKLNIWQQEKSWEEAEQTWDEGSLSCAKKHPLKTLTSLPNIPGITPETAKGLRRKSIQYLLSNDPKKIFLRYFFKNPVTYGWRFLKSLLKKHAYRREGDFFFYGIESMKAFEEALQEKETLLVIGFSYCHKPFECPSGRFSEQCIHDPNHPVCRQCFIGKAMNALPSEESIIPLFIPTIHYIGEKMFEIVTTHPNKSLLFLITACEMTLEMFGDWGNMINARGIGVRLDGRICNTMKAFELSEAGIKPGLTVVLPGTQSTMLDLIKQLWKPPPTPL